MTNTTTILENRKAQQPRLNYARVAPDVLQAMLALFQPVTKSGLEQALLDLVKLRASQLNGCALCIDMHFREAKERGESDERLYLLDAWREAEVYTARERAALRWTEELTLVTKNHVPDAAFAEASEHFTEAELANLTLAIVTINGWNRFNIGFRAPPGYAD